MGRCDFRAHWPVLGGMVRGGSISELKGVFSLFSSEVSSETATLKALRWISELTSEELSLKWALSCYSALIRKLVGVCCVRVVSAES